MGKRFINGYNGDEGHGQVVDSDGKTYTLIEDARAHGYLDCFEARAYLVGEEPDEDGDVHEYTVSWDIVDDEVEDASLACDWDEFDVCETGYLAVRW